MMEHLVPVYLLMRSLSAQALSQMGGRGSVPSGTKCPGAQSACLLGRIVIPSPSRSESYALHLLPVRRAASEANMILPFAAAAPRSPSGRLRWRTGLGAVRYRLPAKRLILW